MASWHYEKNGERHGPVTDRQLSELAASGKLQPSDHVWKEGMPNWAAAASVKGLFSKPSPTIPPPPPPQSGRMLDQLQPLPAQQAYPSQTVPVTAQPVTGMTVPILVSAISNIVVGLIWVSTCFGIVFAIPMFVLCVFEFSLYAKIEQLHPAELAAKAKTLGIFEIIVGLVNTPTLICGIILCINANKCLNRP